MARTFRHTNDDDLNPLDENGVLKDGRSARVSLMDAVSAREHQRPHLHDGRGNPVGHRPGFVVSDASDRDEREHAYSDYEADLVSAYKRNGRLTSVPDTRDAITMDDILARYVRELCYD
jgi:hypothetical protein